MIILYSISAQFYHRTSNIQNIKVPANSNLLSPDPYTNLTNHNQEGDNFRDTSPIDDFYNDVEYYEDYEEDYAYKSNNKKSGFWSIVQNNLLTNPYKSKSKPKTLRLPNPKKIPKIVKVIGNTKKRIVKDIIDNPYKNKRKPKLPELPKLPHLPDLSQAALPTLAPNAAEILWAKDVLKNPYRIKPKLPELPRLKIPKLSRPTLPTLKPNAAGLLWARDVLGRSRLKKKYPPVQYIPELPQTPLPAPVTQNPELNKKTLPLSEDPSVIALKRLYDEFGDRQIFTNNGGVSSFSFCI